MAIGDISSRFESRGTPSQTPSDTGEQSYGTFQILGDPPKAGKDPQVIKFLRSSGYQEKFKGLKVNSDDFKAKWKELGENDPLFGEAQYRFICQKHFYPLASYADKIGLSRTPAIDEALFSMGVQHGRAKSIVDSALKTIDLSKSTEEQVINALYDARTAYVKNLIKDHKGREEDLEEVLKKRYPAERAAVLDMMKSKNLSGLNLEKLFEQMGLSPEEAKKAAAQSPDRFDADAMLKQLKALSDWYKKNQIVGNEKDPDDDEDDDETSAPLPPPLKEDPAIRAAERADILKFLEFLDGVGGKIQSRSLQQTVGIIKYVMQGYDAINALSSIGSGAAAGSVLGPIGALGGALLGIIGLFGSSGPNATEIILRQLDHLSEQIEGVRKYISEIAKELFENQKEIMEALYHGFFALNLELDNQAGSLRLDLTDRLDKISKAVIDSFSILRLELKEVSLQALKMRYEDVKTVVNYNASILGKPETEVPALAKDLFNWAVLGSTAEHFTGRTVYRVAPPPDVFPQVSTDILKSILFADKRDSDLKEDMVVGNLIGYLASYYVAYSNQNLSSTFDITAIPHPQLWYDIAQKYLAAKQATLQYDTDPEGTQTKRIIEAGMTFNKLINSIAQDQHFWSLMCVRYINLTLRLRKAQIDFAEAYSDTFKTRWNEKTFAYAKDKVTDWNFLTSPDRLIGLMGLRKIGEVIAFNNELGVTNTRPLLSVWFNWMPQTLIAAEYIEIASFVASQSGAFNPPFYCINPIKGNEYNEVDQKLNQRGGKHSDGDTLYGKGGMELLCKQGSGERLTQWTFPVQLALHGKEIPWGYNVGHFNFVGSYDGLAVDVRFWARADVEFVPGSHGSDRAIYHPYYCSPGNSPGSYEYELPRALPKYIGDQWAHADQLNVTSQQLIQPSEIAQVKTFTEAEFLKHRKAIAKILKEGRDDLNGTSANRQNHLNEYRNILSELDIHVRLMQLFCYLMGKDVANSFFSSLFTTETVERFLNDFQNGAQIGTPFLHEIRNITAHDFTILPPLSEEQLSGHPRQLFARINLPVDRYEQSKKVHSHVPLPAVAPHISGMATMSLGISSTETFEISLAEREFLEHLGKEQEALRPLHTLEMLMRDVSSTPTSRMLAEEGRASSADLGIRAMVEREKARLGKLTFKGQPSSSPDKLSSTISSITKK